MDAFPPPLERHLDSLAKTVRAILAGSPPLPSPPPTPSPPTPPPAQSYRWMLIAAAVMLVGLGGWYVATHRPAPPAVPNEITVASPSATVAQPTATAATAPDTSEQDALAAKEAQEKEEREAALRAQLAETQAHVAKMQEEAQQRRNAIIPGQNGPWLFPDSSSRYLSRDELMGLNADQLWRARNEIYARNGYRFSSPRGLAFARSLGDYYRGVDPDDDRVFNRMNPFEQANVSLIKSLEQR